MSIPDAQLAEFKEAFTFFDADGDGFMTVEELATVVRSLGQFPSQSQLKEATASLGKDRVDFDGFLKVMTTVMQTQDSMDEIMEAFRVFDKDETGMMNVGELRHIMLNFGEPMPTKALDKMLADAKPDKTGMINYKEFIKKLLAK